MSENRKVNASKMSRTLRTTIDTLFACPALRFLTDVYNWLESPLSSQESRGVNPLAALLSITGHQISNSSVPAAQGHVLEKQMLREQG